MSSLIAARSRWHQRTLALLLVLAAATITAHAQCPPKDPAFAPKPVINLADEEPLLPESGYLSFTRYTNVFFAFGFDLPPNVQWQPIILPITPEKEHALLALRYEKGKHSGYITITAVDPRPGLDVATPEQQEKRAKPRERSGGDNGLSSGFQIPDYMLHSPHFYYKVRHKGSNYGAEYWTNIRDYAIKVVIFTSDHDVMRNAKSAMADARFYCLQEDRTLEMPDGNPVKLEGRRYEGPTIPTFRVNAALRDQPARKIPFGSVSGGVYRNPELGMQYDLPKGWEVLPGEGIDDPPRGEIALRENAFYHACTQTLLRIMAPESDATPGIPVRPMIVLRAMDPNCLSMRTATRMGDKQVTDEVAANLEVLGEFGQIATDELASTSDHLFMVFHGTTGSFSTGGDLAKRLSQTILATRYNKLLLVWTVTAPNAEALNQVPRSSITFAGSPPIEMRGALSAKR